MKIKDLKLGEIKARNVTASSAEVSADVVKATGDPFSGEDEANYSKWIVEDGGWRITDCESFGESSDSEDVSLETARSWPARWCQLDPNTTREHVREVMGEPTDKFEDQDQWDAHHFSFTVFYKNDGTVSQLDIGSTDDLTDAEKASITCDESRHSS